MRHRSIVDGHAILAELTRTPLLFSNGQDSTATHFAIRLRWITNDSTGAHVGYDCLVIRNGADIALVLLSPDGRPYCFLTRGLLICVTPEGHLAVATHGAPILHFASVSEHDQMEAFAGFSGKATISDIRVDLKSILDILLRKATSVTTQSDGQAIDVHTPKSAAIVRFVIEKNVVKLTGLYISSNNEVTVAAELLDPRAYRARFVGVTPAQIADKNIVVDTADLVALSYDFLRPSARLDTDPEMRHAAEELGDLIGFNNSGPLWFKRFDQDTVRMLP